jgi:DNA repair exonuclease SbcCD nuclease subunit
MPKILFCSDAHYGLKSAGFDRTEEIHRVMMGLVDRAIAEKVDLFVHGGDLGHTSNPSSHIHALWMQLFLRLEEAKIHSRFMLGNHDVTNKAGHPYGSLGPLKEIGLEYVWPVFQPMVEGYHPFEVMYLPYVSRSHISDSHKTLDEWNEHYIWGMREWVESNPSIPKFAFTHLNPEGAELHEGFHLRPIHAKVPPELFELGLAGTFGGHIHSPQVVMYGDSEYDIVGAPIATDFGDTAEKRAILIETLDSGTFVTSILTDCTSLIELEYDLIDSDDTDLEFDPSDIEGAGIKVKVRCTQDQREQIDLKAFQKRLEQAGAAFVRPITPTIVRREERSVELIEPSMGDSEIVRAWIEAKKPTNKELVKECAIEALECN